MADDRELVVDSLLQQIAEELDIPPGKYEEAVKRYTAVGRWLEDGDYPESHGKPSIYVQGSFRLGTVVRPLRDGKEREYDIDLACEVKMSKASTTPATLKHLVGDRLKANGTYKKMLEPEGRRCWTLIYAEEEGAGFHLDALPCVLNSIYSPTVDHRFSSQAIEITDRKGPSSYVWGKSNPNGFADWFLERQRVVFTKIAAARKKVIQEQFSEIYAEVKDVPDQLVRTPLQRLVQVLKRHRDARFSGQPNEGDKPISIIITTLAAQAYNQEPDVFDALANFVHKTIQWEESELIKSVDGRWIIENPVNPDENFADRWNDEGSKKEEAFFQWIHWIQEDMDDLLNATTKGELETAMRRAFGSHPANKVTGRFTGTLPGLYSMKSSFGRQLPRQLRFDAQHKLAPRWRMEPRKYKAEVKAKYNRNGFRPRPFHSNSVPLRKNVGLVFEVETTAPKPYDVHWQVVNTGDEATRRNGLRGDFYDSNRSGKKRTEDTLYTGTHWVEAFVVKDGVCVARTGEFVVNIE